ncbi:MAG: transcriptional repressor LexA [Deltaproteobacteria bacterium]|nr:transcriptional repressor LexA [Deltaproteobacteria bacterium]
MRTGVRVRTAADAPGVGPKQREVLGFLHDYVLRNGFPPSVREIAEGVHLASPSSVAHHLAELEAKGHIFRRRDALRAIQVIDPGLPQRPAPLLPLVGRVAAGQPLLAVEHIEEYVTAPAGALRATEGCFALRVVGDSMRDAGILDGDVVIVRPDTDVAEGAIAAVRLEDPLTGEAEVTVKRVFRDARGLRLEPANPAYAAMRVESADIEGVVVALIRTY